LVSNDYRYDASYNRFTFSLLPVTRLQEGQSERTMRTRRRGLDGRYTGMGQRMSETNSRSPQTTQRTAVAAPAPEGSAPFPWLFAYFRQIYSHRVEVVPEGLDHVWLTDEELSVEALHLAFSYDGLHWTALNGNQPVLPVATRHERVRDPFIRRGLDGAFHLLATGGSAATDISYARSGDLIHWEERRALPVMGSVARARNAWAPEFVIDHAHHDYFVFWSTSSGAHGWDDSRIWCARTPDFRTFSTPRVLFDPGFTVIDATIVPFQNRFYLFFKDERFGYAHGEHRFIQVAVAPELEGPYTAVAGAVTPSITEGPAIMRGPEDDRWYLFYDHCMDNCYGASVSDDLLHWQVIDGTEFPPNARHGSVFPVSEVELAALRSRFP
jgi:hypothetical protein